MTPMVEDDAHLDAEENSAKDAETRQGHKKSFRERFHKLKIDNQIIAISNVVIATTTGLYVLVSILTWLTISSNSDTSSRQTEKLITAAKIQAGAAQRNADSAEAFRRAAERQATASEEFSKAAIRQANAADSTAQNIAAERRVQEKTFLNSWGDAVIKSHHMEIYDLGIGQKVHVRIFFENDGKANASDLSIAMNTDFGKKRGADPTAFVSVPGNPSSDPMVPLQSNDHIYDRGRYFDFFGKPVSKPAYSAYRRFETRFYIWGILRYKGSLREKTPYSFCKYVTAHEVPEATPRSGYGYGKTGEPFHDCD